MKTASAIIRLLRPHQWIKSGFVLTGLIFGHRWQDPEAVLLAGLAVIAFSLASSGVYIINDLRDAPHDRLHPTKKKRPLAANEISVSMAGALAALLLASAAVIGFYVSWIALLILALYAAMNLGYSYGLKHIVILDVFLISLGFMFRILMGTLGIGIEPSQWLLFCGLTMTLFLGFCKRRAELLLSAGAGGSTRRVLEHYTPHLLDLMIAITAACAVLAYCLYTIDDRTILIHRTNSLIYTAPLVIYAIFRYLYIIYREGGGEDTARDIIRDKHILASVMIWGVSVIWLTWA